MGWLPSHRAARVRGAARVLLLPLELDTLGATVTGSSFPPPPVVKTNDGVEPHTGEAPLANAPGTGGGGEAPLDDPVSADATSANPAPARSIRTTNCLETTAGSTPPPWCPLATS